MRIRTQLILLFMVLLMGLGSLFYFLVESNKQNEEEIVKLIELKSSIKGLIKASDLIQNYKRREDVAVGSLPLKELSSLKSFKTREILLMKNIMHLKII